MEQFSIAAGFWPDLPKYEQQLLNLMIVAGQHKTDDGHQQSWQALPIQHQLDHFLQSCCLPPIVRVLYKTWPQLACDKLVMHLSMLVWGRGPHWRTVGD